MALFATTGWAAAEVRNRTVVVAQIKVCNSHDPSQSHDITRVTRPWSKIDLWTCSTPPFLKNIVSPLQIFAFLEFPLGRSLEVADNCAMVSGLFLSSRSLVPYAGICEVVLELMFQPGRLERLRL